MTESGWQLVIVWGSGCIPTVAAACFPSVLSVLTMIVCWATVVVFFVGVALSQRTYEAREYRRGVLMDQHDVSELWPD